MMLTITTTHRPATDLGYLLHKNPSRAQTFDLAYGKARVVYPEVSEDRCAAALILDVAGDQLDDTAKSLVRVLVDNRRLELLPEVRDHFEKYRAEAEKVIEAEVVSAFPLSDEQQAQNRHQKENYCAEDVTGKWQAALEDQQPQ